MFVEKSEKFKTKKISVNFEPYELNIVFEDLKNLTKYKAENKDKFDLEGRVLISKLNEHYPMYGGFEKELDIPTKPSYGI